MKTYGREPIEIASEVIIDNTQMYFYQYLPIQLIECKYDLHFAIPDQLYALWPMLLKVKDDFIKTFGEEEYYRSNIYLTAKCLYVKGGENINRMGWHCDGFMSEDINYIWCDCIPTEYVTGNFELIQDHRESIEQMNKLFYKTEPFKCNINTIYRLDETVIHRCDYNRSKDAVLRHFVKVSFSKEKYNLKGNSHNYLLDYEWEMKERSLQRNHPNK